MRFFSGMADTAMLLGALQWAYMLSVLGYEKWGWLGGAVGLITSPALLPFSPFVAWMFIDDGVQLIWFYGLGATWLACTLAVGLLTPRIVSDYPHR